MFDLINLRYVAPKTEKLNATSELHFKLNATSELRFKLRVFNIIESGK